MLAFIDSKVTNHWQLQSYHKAKNAKFINPKSCEFLKVLSQHFKTFFTIFLYSNQGKHFKPSKHYNKCKIMLQSLVLVSLTSVYLILVLE